MEWYYAEGDRRIGPVTEEEFQRLVASGKIADSTEVWQNGMAAWVAYSTLRATSPSEMAKTMPGHVKKGFIASLFDLSFTEFVTTRIVTFLYVLAIVGSAIVALSMVIAGYSDSEGTGFVALLFSPFVFFLYVLFARVWLEVIVVLFRIAENTGRLVEQNRRK